MGSQLLTMLLLILNILIYQPDHGSRVPSHVSTTVLLLLGSSLCITRAYPGWHQGDMLEKERDVCVLVLQPEAGSLFHQEKNQKIILSQNVSTNRIAKLLAREAR